MNEREAIRMVHRQLAKLRRSGEVLPYWSGSHPHQAEPSNVTPRREVVLRSTNDGGMDTHNARVYATGAVHPTSLAPQQHVAGSSTPDSASNAPPILAGWTP